MKFLFLILSLLLLGIETLNAFPFNQLDDVMPELHQEIRKVLEHQHVKDLLKRASEKRLLVDFDKNPIDVSGAHAFQPPNFAAGDQRGPCPGLNALANHGYISRDGVTNIVEATIATNEVFGMGIELGLFLTIVATVWVGNPLALPPSFSIGGKSKKVQNILNNAFGILGTPRGLDGSHNIIEADSSSTRADLYVTGDASTLRMDQFMEWYNMSPDGLFTADIAAKRAAIRFDESVATNPNFYFGPYTGLLARNAGFIFPVRYFANYSLDNLSGRLTKDIVKSFFGVSGPEGNLVYNRGWERIPENWHRNPIDYGLIGVNLDIVGFILKYPRLGSIGGNLGKVNSFAGLNPGDITGGVFNTVNLLQGNNLVCFALQVVKLISPNWLSTIYSVIAEPLKLVTDTIGLSLLNLSCPALLDLTIGGGDFEQELKKMYPGVQKSGFAF